MRRKVSHLHVLCSARPANVAEGGGKGNWSAWKAGEMARRYEAQGGGYKNTPGSKNKPKKGAPEKKQKEDDDEEEQEEEDDKE